jgi:hypothetical protein
MQSRRHGDILKLLESEGSSSVGAIARALGVSAETIRRDLRPLAELLPSLSSNFRMSPWRRDCIAPPLGRNPRRTGRSNTKLHKRD